MSSTRGSGCRAEVCLHRAWQVEVERSFEKDIRHLPKSATDRIWRAVEDLACGEIVPRGSSLQPLRYEKGKWRYRLGGFRLLFVPDFAARVVRLVAFHTRDHVYAG